MAKITREEIGEGFYTYAFLREDGSPYYVGKGKGDRAWNGRAQGARRPPKNPERILILKKELTEEEAFRHERYMIAVYGRKDLGTGILRNMTDGGEGPSGAVRNAETRAKISAAHKGKQGKQLSDETRAKLSAAHKGKQVSAETRAKISAANRGKQRSNEIRAKISAANRGRQSSLETRAKISAALQGEKNSNAKSFVFTNPEGEEFIVTGAFKAFCREQGLAWETMRDALGRNCRSPLRSGWRVRRLDKVAP